jgi:BMFP domain-containing protein YqiC
VSDDPVLAALARLEANVARLETRLEASIARVETEQTRMREQFGNKLDDILDKLRVVREDTDTARAHVLYGLHENMTLSQRITKLEDEIRRPLT